MNSILWRFSRETIEEALERVLPLPDKGIEPERVRLQHAMRDAVFNGGKRLRSQLLLEAAHAAATARGVELDCDAAFPAACAIELIHAYSLVHDDLPSMDNSDTRRGRPSCHKQWGEATAILVGDALLTLAFEIMAHTPPESSAPALRATAVIAGAAGERGMVGGQTIDIAWSNPQENDGVEAMVTGEKLLAMHSLKTGALIRAACEAGGILGGGDEKSTLALAQFGAQLGRAFQLKDDLLDVEGDPQITGKAPTDVANDKITAPVFFGIEETRRLARRSQSEAIAALKYFGAEADALRQLARFVVERIS